MTPGQKYLELLRTREIRGQQLQLLNFSLKKSDFFSSSDFILLPNSIKFLEMCHCPKIENFPDLITDKLCEMSNLEVCRIESLTWLSPGQVKKVLENCRHLVVFHFTPRWVRSIEKWCVLYEKEASCLSGKDFLALYLKVRYFFTSSHYLQMAKRTQPLHWSSHDTNSSTSGDES